MAEIADVLSASNAPLNNFTERTHLVPFADEMYASSIRTHANNVDKLTLKAYPRTTSSVPFDVPKALRNLP